jgi:hypothetical protein
MTWNKKSNLIQKSYHNNLATQNTYCQFYGAKFMQFGVPYYVLPSKESTER